MKRYIAGILLIVTGAVSAKAQQGENPTGLSKGYSYVMSQIVPDAPQSAIFQQYINHEITEYSGIPKIEIPLYEIKVKEGSIPITLSYHASGIKYRQDDGDVGVGWSINAGGYRIMKKIRGRDDFDGFTRYDSLYHDATMEEIRKSQFPVYNRNEYLASYSYASSSIDGYEYFNYAVHDGERDLYTYILPTYSGKYIVPEADPGSAKNFQVKNNNILVDLNSQKEWSITDHQGNIFSFGSEDESAREMYNDPTRVTLGPNTVQKNRLTQSWLLTKMKTPFNETVDFSYMEKKKTNYSPSPGLSNYDAAILNPYELPVREVATSGSEYNIINPRRESTLFTTYNKYIETIKTEHETVTFNRGVEINGHLIEHLLESIEIKDLSSNTIKKISFKYIYTSPNKKRDPYVHNMDLRAPHHILLDSVSIGSQSSSVENYKLDYHMPESMKSIDADQWGYYTWAKYSQYEDADTAVTDGVRILGNVRSPIHEALPSETNRLISQYVTCKKENITSEWNNILITIYSDPKNTENPIVSVPPTNHFNTMDRSPKEKYTKLFMLKKITNPLGGYTEYEYEPNQWNRWTKTEVGAGLRIKRIISKSNSETPSITTHFKYNKGTTKGDLEYFNLLRFFSGFHFSIGYKGPDYNNMTPSSDELDFQNMRISRTFLSRPNVEMFDEASQIVYAEVTTSLSDENGNFLGKTTSQYDNLQNISYGNYQIQSSPIYSMLKTRAQKDLEILPKDFNGHLYPKELKILSQPRLISRIYYNSLGNTIQTEDYEYTDYEKKEDKVGGFKTKQLLTTADYAQDLELTKLRMSTDEVKLRAIHLFEYGSPITNTGYSLLNKKTVSKISDSGSVLKIEEFYNYDDKNQLIKTTQTNSGTGSLTKSMTYPYDFALGNNVYQQMVTKNMISPVVEQTSTHNDKEIGKIKTEYTSDANKTKGLILPGYVQTSSNGDSRTDVTYNKYDTKGNILQYTTFDDISTCYLWSYKGQYPVAEIKNASYEEVTNALTGTTPEAISALDKPDMTPIDGLRNKLPHALITTYTYKPLVGMTSMIDPAGVKTIYRYDDFGRLKETLIEENGKQNPVNTYQYHYRTSSEQ